MLKAGRTCALLFYTLILCVIAFFPAMDYAAKNPLAEWNIWFIVGVLVFGGSVSAIVGRAWQGNGNRLNNVSWLTPLTTCFTQISFAVMTAFAALQQYIIGEAWFVTGWDAYAAVKEAVEPGYHALAYSYYPNNLAIIGIFRFFIRLLHADDFETAYLLIIRIGGLIVSFSCLLIVYAARRITSSVWCGYAALLLCGAYIVLSPHCMIPYTDTYGMLAPSVILLLYASKLPIPLKGGGIVFVAILGSKIKPNAIIPLIALCLVELCKSNVILRLKVLIQHKKNLKKALLVFAMVSVGGSSAIVMGEYVVSYTTGGGTISDAELSMSPAHYLMMGWNEGSGGGYSLDDVNFSTGIENYDERVKENLKIFSTRVQEMGPVGVGRQIFRKILSTYGDGTGSWGKEGGWVSEIYGTSQPIQAFYGINTDSPSAYTYVAQVLWLFILCGIVFQWLSPKPPLSMYMVNITLLGQGLFLILFECRARYLIQFWPYFVLAAIFGWRAFARKCCHMCATCSCRRKRVFNCH